MNNNIFNNISACLIICLASEYFTKHPTFSKSFQITGILETGFMETTQCFWCEVIGNSEKMVCAPNYAMFKHRPHWSNDPSIAISQNNMTDLKWL